MGQYDGTKPLLKGHEFAQTPSDDGQRSLGSCSKWGCRVGQDSMTEQLNFFPFLCKSKGLPWWLSCKESTCIVGDLGSIPVLGRFLGEGNGYPLQYSGLENSIV